MGTRRRRDVAGEITKWFRTCKSDNFIPPDRADPFWTFGPAQLPAITLFSTKPGTLGMAFKNIGIPRWLSIVGRSGLPDDNDAAWIQRLVGKSEFRFVGDLDPTDLMIYVWLRERIHRPQPKYVGVSDRFAFKTRALSQLSWRIALTAAELEGLRLLQTVAPDINGLVGPKCSRILKEGRKLELDAVVAAGGLREARLAVRLRAPIGG